MTATPWDIGWLGEILIIIWRNQNPHLHLGLLIYLKTKIWLEKITATL